MHLGATLYEIFDREGIDLILSLPCNKLQGLIGHLPDRFRHIPLTREENGVGISAGACLTSGRPLMLIPSTGLGNAFNALASIHKACHLPLPVVASWRGSKNDPFPGQVPLGRALPEILTALDIPFTVIERPEQLSKVGDAIRDAFLRSTPHIILICPKLLDEDEDRRVAPVLGTRSRRIRLPYDGKIGDPILTRHEALGAMSDSLRDAMVVATLGQTCGDLCRIGDRDLNFYLMGGMGQASAVGLGMALNTNRHVYVLDGDGSLLMNPNIFCQISMSGPENLTIVVLDNGTYGTTGDQRTAAYDRIDLELVARSFGINHTMKASTKEEIAQALASFRAGPNLLHVPTKPGKLNAHPDLMPVQVKERFMGAISHEKRIKDGENHYREDFGEGLRQR